MSVPNEKPVAAVVNDSSSQLEILAWLLKKAGIAPLTFTSAEAALSAMDPVNPPDLIVSDLYMPGIDGWRFCRLLRSPEYAAFNPVPLLVVSATFAGDQPERIAADLGANAFLPTPVDREEFIAQARALVAGKLSRRQPRVLIVEDNADFAEMLAEMFTLHGYQADKASTVREAQAASARVQFDVAVIDYHLPDASGDSLLEFFQKDRPDCVCLMVTGDSSPQLALEWMKRGASAYVRKPFDPELLIELCARARRERALLRAEDLLEARTRELREREAFYRALFENVSDAVLVHEIGPDGLPGKFVAANQVAVKYLGYTQEELLALTPKDIAADNAFVALAEIRASIASTGDSLFETVHRSREGRHIPVESHVSVLELGGRRVAISVVRDLSERRRAEAQLRESEERHRSLFMEMQEGFALHEVICDASGRPCDYRYLEVNPAFERATGIPRERWIGHTVREVLPQVEDFWIQGFGQVALTGKAAKFENYVRQLDRYYEVVAYSPKLGQFAVIALDITERKRTELALQRRDALLDAALRASGLLLSARTPGEALGDIVRLLGEASGQDRAYYFAWRCGAAPGKVTISLRHEWVREGIAPQQGNPLLQELSFDQIAPYSCERLRQGLEVCSLVRDLPASEREVLEPQQIVALLLAPITVNGTTEGFLGFDNCRTEYAWSAGERAALAVVTVNLGAAFLRARAEAELLAQRERLQSIAANLPGIVYQFYAMPSGEFGVSYVSERINEILEIPSDADRLFPRIIERVHPDDRDAFMTSIQTAVATVSPWRFEGRFIKPSGGVFWFSGASNPVGLADRVVFNGLLLDITERRRAEEELRLNEQRLGTLLELNRMTGVSESELTSFALESAVHLTGSSIGYIAFVNEEETVLTMYAWSKAAMQECAIENKPVSYIVSEAGLLGEPIRQRQAVITNDYAAPNPVKKGVPEGHVRLVRHMNVPVFEGEKIVIVAGVGNKPANYSASDVRQLTMLMSGLWTILRRRRAEEKSEQALAMLQSALAQSPSGILIADAPDVTIRWANAAALGIRGETSLPLTGIDVAQHSGRWQTFRTDGRPYPSEELPLSRAVLKGEVTHNEEVIIRHASGADCWVSVNAAPIRSGDGAVTAGIVVFSDITARKQAEEQLREAEAMQRELLVNMPAGVVIVDPETRMIEQVNEHAAALFGATKADLLGNRCHAFLCPAEAGACPVCDQGKSIDNSECVMVRTDGTPLPILKTVKRISLGGRVKLLECFVDISDRKRAEEERAKLQAQLTQAQKMESVGRLAGGVAHDFNNMLQAILGHAELVLQDLPPGSPFHDNLSEIKHCAQRSADLTRQLLAFARKQTIVPKVLDLNETVEGSLKMLRRLIGEHIELAWRPGHHLWPVRIDPTQVDQILANLCVNARDAIADVGRITLETENTAVNAAYCAQHAGFTPGDYVMLAVSDSGGGMDAETVAHIFEPFFTTKEIGKGTGLGLATVYGVVRQNNGLIEVNSEPGRGTTFKIFLPRHAAKGAQEMAGRQLPAPPTRGSETILVVEDETMILNLMRQMLGNLGYTVLAAHTPGEAIRIAREHSGRIELLLTDVVMPEMNGRDLAKNIIALHPGIKRLFASGYTADVIAHQGVLEPGIHFIQKPFSPHALAEKIREALEN